MAPVHNKELRKEVLKRTLMEMISTDLLKNPLIPYHIPIHRKIQILLREKFAPLKPS